MYDNKLYENGVHSVLKVEWTLQCETPLVVRNGLSVRYRENNQRPKVRGRNINFEWKPKKSKSDHEVAALTYGYRIVDETVEPYHIIPASSVRGALRSWTINQLVDPSLRDRFVAPTKGDDNEKVFEDKAAAHVKKVEKALENQPQGYQLIASLFGLALETRSEVHDLSNAGRLRLETQPFSHAQPQPITANGTVANGMVGAVNAKRQMTVRNPLDRITHASKDGGLHHFLEFSRGQTFTVSFTVRNPEQSDLGLFYLWKREIDDGLLRIGALSNIGRGRLSVQNDTYTLWQLPTREPFPHTTSISDDTNDILSDLWQRYTVDVSELAHFVEGVHPHVSSS